MELRTVRERLALILLALLPFHAFGVTVLTNLIDGPGRPPIAQMVLWKEGLLMLIVLIAMWELFLKRLRHRFWIDFDPIDGLVVLLVIVASLIGLRFDAFLSTRFLYGFRYDLFLPLCFLVLRRVQWSGSFKESVFRILLWAGVVVSVAGIVMLLLPVSALQALGYSDLHSLYQSAGPLAPFQLIGETGIRRMQSVMSGPNQLGLWLLLPYAVALSSLLQGGVKHVRDLWALVRSRPWLTAAFFLLDLSIGLTFSRAAWVAAGVIVLVCLWRSCTRGVFLRVVAAIACIGAVAVGVMMAVSPGVLLRATSNSHHLERPLEALRLMRQHPLGLGLGTAGPATNRLSDTCVQLPEGSDASWAVEHPQLCVMVGKSQVQPLDRVCTCPVLPENWYLQIGVELGVLGMALYLALMGFLLKKAWVSRPVSLAFLGVLAANLVLHGFEDFGVSATLWVLLAALL